MKGNETTIDASDLWAGNMPGITINGSKGGNWEGITISVDHCAVYGLYITDFEDDGIQITPFASNNIIIGGSGHRANVLGNCWAEGIEIYGGSNTVYGNYIGVTPDGNPIGNGGCNGLGGVVFGKDTAINNRLENNVIAYNYAQGIKSWKSKGSGNLITRNSFYQNKAKYRDCNYNHDGLGIDHNEDGPTLNDGQKNSSQFKRVWISLSLLL